MTNDCLAALRICCSPTMLPSLELLVSIVGVYTTYSSTSIISSHHYNFAAFLCPCPPGAVCVGEGRDAPEQCQPSWGHVWKHWASVCLLQCVSKERRGHDEDRNKPSARKPSSHPEYRCKRSGLTGSHWLTPLGPLQTFAMFPVQGLQLSEDLAYVVVKACVLCGPGESSTTKWDSLHKMSSCSIITVPTPNKALPILPGQAASHFGIYWAMKDPSGAAFTFEKWRQHLSVSSDVM